MIIIKNLCIDLQKVTDLWWSKIFSKLKYAELLGASSLGPSPGLLPWTCWGFTAPSRPFADFFFLFFSRLWREKSPAAFHKLNLEHKMVLWQNTWKNSWPILTLTKMFRSKLCYRNYQHHLSVFNFLLFFSNHNIAN